MNGDLWGRLVEEHILPRLQAKHCSVCGRPIAGLYFQIEGTPGLFCETCFRTRPRCDTCSAPVSDDHTVLADGRIQCRRCRGTAILDMPSAIALYGRVIERLHLSPGLYVTVQPTLKLVGIDELKRVSQRAPQVEPTTATPLGLFYKRGSVRIIYALSALPQLVMLKVLAHEYGHAWLAEHCPLQRDLVLIEGFCEWAAYKVLAGYGATKAMDVMRQRRDAYGDGLRRVLELEQQGEGYVFQVMQAS